MFNLYQYSQHKNTERRKSKEQKMMSTFWSKHQDFKKVAKINRKTRLDDFIDSQVTSDAPQIIPDDYMGRSRSENQYHKERYGELESIIGLNKIRYPQEQPKKISKNSFNNNVHEKSKESLRLTSQDRKHLASAQETQAMKNAISYSAARFSQKADLLLRQFQKSKEKFNRFSYINRDRYRLCNPTQCKQVTQQTQNKTKKQLPRTRSIKENNPQQASLPISFNQVEEVKPHNKTYFKLAKTEQMFTKDNMKKIQLDSLLSRSHYNRVKNDKYATKTTAWPTFSNFSPSHSVEFSQN